MNLVVQHLCKSTGDKRIFSLKDAFIDREKLVGNCFGQVEQIAVDTITLAVDIASGEIVQIAELINRGSLRSGDP